MVASAQPNLPDPSGFGWKIDTNNGNWIPIWITIPEVANCTNELVKCQCKGNCNSCSCGKVNLPCTPLCEGYYLCHLSL